jgi:hypothetical protein
MTNYVPMHTDAHDIYAAIFSDQQFRWTQLTIVLKAKQVGNNNSST